jgi:hypothetical protein
MHWWMRSVASSRAATDLSSPASSEAPPQTAEKSAAGSAPLVTVSLARNSVRARRLEGPVENLTHVVGIVALQAL